jgi:hypothetical protein
MGLEKRRVKVRENYIKRQQFYDDGETQPHAPLFTRLLLQLAGD